MGIIGIIFSTYLMEASVIGNQLFDLTHLYVRPIFGGSIGSGRGCVCGVVFRGIEWFRYLKVEVLRAEEIGFCRYFLAMLSHGDC